MLFSTDFGHFSPTPGAAGCRDPNVWAMNLRQYLIASGSAAMTMLADATELAPRELIDAGAEPTHLDRIVRLHNIYYGPTKSHRRQRKARGHAIEKSLGFDRLEAIEGFVDKLYDKSKSWALRHDLTRFNGNHHDFRAHAKEKLAALNVDKPKRKRETSVKVTHHEGTTKSTLTLCADSASIREIEATARATAAEHDTTVAQALVDTFFSGTSAPIYRIKVLVTLDDVKRILSGEGADVLVQTTTGAVMTGMDLVRKKLDPIAEFIGVTPMHGAITIGTGRCIVNTRKELNDEQHRRATNQKAGATPIPPEAVAKATARHGTYKDRCLLEATQTTCAGMDCSVPAAYCEINHNVPYSRGGLSLLSNESLLCSYHNGKAGSKQRYRNIRGRPYRILPGGKLALNHHPLARSSPVEKILAPAVA